MILDTVGTIKHKARQSKHKQWPLLGQMGDGAPSLITLLADFSALGVSSWQLVAAVCCDASLSNV